MMPKIRSGRGEPCCSHCLFPSAGDRLQRGKISWINKKTRMDIR
jgi:hypothetical protein